MQSSEFAVGAKATIHSHNWRSSRHEKAAVVEIVSISPRVMKTSDGKRWHPLRGFALTESGKEDRLGDRIYPYQDGDEAIVKRIGLINQCRSLLTPVYRQDSPVENSSLLSDEDWSTLAQIAKRYADAKNQQSKQETCAR